MTASEDKFVPSALIPWIMALTVWLGWNAVAPDQWGEAMDSAREGAGLVHQTDDLPAHGTLPHPLAGLVPDPRGSIWFRGLPSQRLGIEVQRERSTGDARWEGIQGRAPPLRA